MRLRVEIDLSAADIAGFDRYEARVLARLPLYGGRLLSRTRDEAAPQEIHDLFFPTDTAFEAFLADPVRQSLGADWAATSAVGKVFREG